MKEIKRITRIITAGGAGGILRTRRWLSGTVERALRLHPPSPDLAQMIMKN